MIVKVIKLTFVSVNKSSFSIPAHILPHIFPALPLVALVLFFQVFFMGGFPKTIILAPRLLPRYILAQTLKVIRILNPPYSLVLNLSCFLAFWLRTNLLLRTVFVGNKFILTDLTTHTLNITYKTTYFKST